MSKLLSLKIADRLQPIVLSFSKGTGTVRGASIDLRELAGSNGNDFTGGRPARRWNSHGSGCEYSRWKGCVEHPRSFDWPKRRDQTLKHRN
jgi:hypothetical protein